MIPYLDLKAQYQSIKKEIDEAVFSVLQSGQYVLGQEVSQFEEEFAAYCGVGFTVALNSGTSALHLSLLACGVGPGDEVITTPLTFVATTAAIIFTGAKPVFVDVDPHTLNMDPAKVASALTSRTRAILPVHLHGLPADMDPLLELAHQRHLMVIEDCAQAHGADYKGRRAGSLGNIGCFSFYPGKNLGAYGEGGAITTNNQELAQKIRLLREWGAEKRYHHVLKGFNCRMDSIQGAILRVKLRHLEKWIQSRRNLAGSYDEKFKPLGITTPVHPSELRHVYHVYAIQVEKRDLLRDFLRDQGIDTNIHYPIPVHLQEAYADLSYKKGDFPVTEFACSRLLSLPLYPELSPLQLDEVVQKTTYGIQKGLP